MPHDRPHTNILLQQGAQGLLRLLMRRIHARLQHCNLLLLLCHSCQHLRARDAVLGTHTQLCPRMRSDIRTVRRVYSGLERRNLCNNGID